MKQIFNALPERDRITMLKRELEACKAIAVEAQAVNTRLQASCKIMQAELDAVPDMLFAVDPSGRILRANSSRMELLGVLSRDLLEKTIADVLPPTAAQICLSALREAHETGSSKGLQYSLDSPQGPLFFELSVTALTAMPGAGPRFIVLSRDISERKLMEASLAARERELRALAEISPDIIVRFTIDGRLIYCNRSVLDCKRRCLPWQCLTQCSSGDQAAQLEGTYANLVRQITEGNKRGEAELVWERDGMPIYMQVRATPECDDAGQISSILVVGREISELKEAEACLRQSRDTLRALSAHREAERESERHEIATLIHEDLAQDLSALRMKLSLLEMDKKIAARRPHIVALRDITDRSIARIRSLITNLRPSAIDMGIVTALRWLADDFENGIGLKFELDLPEEIQLDVIIVTFLFRAAQEALLNIALHAAASHVRLGLELRDNDCVLIIQDDGWGFDPAAPRPRGAFGLIGLAEQAQHLGGQVSINSKPQQGTTLRIQVCSRPCNIQSHPPRQAQPSGTTSRARMGGIPRNLNSNAYGSPGTSPIVGNMKGP